MTFFYKHTFGEPMQLVADTGETPPPTAKTS